MNNIVRIVCISDTHSKHNQIKDTLGEIPDGDILVHAGDISNIGEIQDVNKFLVWFDSLPHKNKVFIAGNHDFLFENERNVAAAMLEDYENINYLENQSKVVQGLKFWGSPVTPPFCNWAFNKEQDYRALLWETIDDDTDILITHGPPRDILDFSPYGNEHAGCPYLKIRVKKVKPLISIHGHIHSGYGVYEEDGTLFVNASTLNERYKVTNKPIVIDVDKENRKVTLVDGG